eukprot:1195871-Prorocentrum_minimum.AAC.1
MAGCPVREWKVLARKLNLCAKRKNPADHRMLHNILDDQDDGVVLSRCAEEKTFRPTHMYIVRHTCTASAPYTLMSIANITVPAIRPIYYFSPSAVYTIPTVNVSHPTTGEFKEFNSPPNYLRTVLTARPSSPC